MAEPIGKPAGRNFEQGDRDIARRENGGDGRRRDVLVLHPPEQIQRVGDPFDRDNPVEGIERQVATNPGSIRRHASIITARDPGMIHAVDASR